MYLGIVWAAKDLLVGSNAWEIKVIFEGHNSVMQSAFKYKIYNF